MERQALFFGLVEQSHRCGRVAGHAGHVVSFAEEIQAPFIPSAEFYLLDGMGHGSWYGHAHERLKAYIEQIPRRNL
jgi:hypothetical protein